MKGLSKEKRDQLILTGLLTVALLVGLWYGLISLQQQKIKSIAQKIVEQKGKVEGAEKLIRLAPDLQARLETAQDKLKGIEQGMASGDMYSWIFLTMNKFKANHKEVDIPQFSREVATEVGVIPRFPYKAVLFNLRGSAYYHDLGKFLADFENAFPYMRVQNLELDPTGGSASNPNSEPTEKLSFKMEVIALVNPTSHSN
jgi:hypothetical protein